MFQGGIRSATDPKTPPGDILRQYLWGGGLVFAVALIVGLSTLPGAFLYDDYQEIVRRDILSGELVPVDYMDSCVHAWRSSFTRRIVRITLAWDFQNAGFHAPRFHVWNALLHPVCVVLFFSLTSMLLRVLKMDNVVVAIMAAAIFALHPMIAETINYVFCRYVLLSTAFTLASLCLYMMAIQAENRRRGVLYAGGAILCWGLAMQSKEVGVLFAPLLAMGFAVTIRGYPKHRGKDKLYFSLMCTCVLLGIVFAGVLFATEALDGIDVLQRTKARFFAHWDFSTRSIGMGNKAVITCWTHFLTQTHVFFNFLSLYIVPFGRLSIDHEVTVSSGVTQPLYTLVSFPGVLMLTAAVVLTPILSGRPHLRAMLAGWQIVLVAYAPYMLIPNPVIMVEYKFYFPVAGLALVTSVGIHALYQYCTSVFAKRAIGSTAGLVLVVWACALVARNRVWQEPEAVWRQAVDRSRTWAHPYVKLSEIYIHRGFRGPHAVSNQALLQKAEQLLHRAVARDVSYADAHTILGCLLIRLGRVEEAVQSFTRSLHVNPSDPFVHGILGTTCYRQGKLDQAVAHLRRVLDIDPENARGHFNLAVVLQAQGHDEEAIHHYVRTLQIAPRYPRAGEQLHALQASYKKDELDALYRRLARDPENAQLLYRVGNLLARQGRFDMAADYLQNAIRIDNDFEAAHNDLGTIYAKRLQYDKAVRHYHEVLRINPDSAVVHNNLGIVLSKLAQWDKAVDHFQKALTITPDFEKARENLNKVQARERK